MSQVENGMVSDFAMTHICPTSRSSGQTAEAGVVVSAKSAEQPAGDPQPVSQ